MYENLLLDWVQNMDEDERKDVCIQFGLIENEEVKVMTSEKRHQLVLFDKIEKELSKKPFSNEELEFILKVVKNSRSFVAVFSNHNEK